MAPTAAAQSLRNPLWQAMADAGRYAELEQVSSARLATQPDDTDAWTAYVRSVLNQRAAPHLQAALEKLEACIDRSPAMAVCHYGVGAVLGAQALSQGALQAAFSARRIRDEFIEALQLDPTHFEARGGLVQFYLLAPGVVGGSVAKAHEVAKATAAREPEGAKLLQVMILEYERKMAEAERLLASVQAGNDRTLVDATRARWLSIGFGWLRQKQPIKAQAIFERVDKEKPGDVITYYGLGRALEDQQQWDAAIATFEQASKLPGRDAVPLDYRLGLAWQAKGNAAKARASYLRYLADGPPNADNVDDAKKRLADLG